MRLKIQLDHGGRLRWTVVRSPEQPEPLARSVRTCPDVQACYRAAVEFSRVPAAATRPTQQPDGSWRWIATGQDGEPRHHEESVERRRPPTTPTAKPSQSDGSYAASTDA